MHARELPLSERFESKFVPEPNSGCWLWLASVSQGYGVIKIGGRYHRAHRVAYGMFRGPVPDGLVIDHLCRNTFCVNPDHLEPVTIGENVRRGFSSRQTAKVTHCAHGHEYTPANTMEYGGRRFCRACNRARSAAWRAKKNG